MKRQSSSIPGLNQNVLIKSRKKIISLRILVSMCSTMYLFVVIVAWPENKLTEWQNRKSSWSPEVPALWAKVSELPWS